MASSCLGHSLAHPDLSSRVLHCVFPSWLPSAPQLVTQHCASLRISLITLGLPLRATAGSLHGVNNHVVPTLLSSWECQPQGPLPPLCFLPPEQTLGCVGIQGSRGEQVSNSQSASQLGELRLSLMSVSLPMTMSTSCFLADHRIELGERLHHWPQALGSSLQCPSAQSS